MSWREIADDNQPLTVTSETVLDFLLRCRQDRMARWLKQQLEMPRQLSQQLEQQRQANERLRERLHKHEPTPKPSEGRSYRAGPMSDG
jgi:hypothetical protein